MRASVGSGLRHRAILLERNPRLGATRPARSTCAGLGLRLERDGHFDDESLAAAVLSQLHRSMNDYLDNLVAKSLGLTEVVAPRPMSLFEPAPSDAGPLVQDYYPLEQDDAPQRMPAGASPMTDVAAPMASKDGSSEKGPPEPSAAQSDQPSHRHVQPPAQHMDRDASLSAPLLIPQRPAADTGQRADHARSAAPVNQQPANGQIVEGRQ